MTIREQINSEYKKREDSLKIIEELRKKCKHKKYRIGYYQWGGPGHVSVSRLCENCDQVLGPASEDEKGIFYLSAASLPSLTL